MKIAYLVGGWLLLPFAAMCQPAAPAAGDKTDPPPLSLVDCSKVSSYVDGGYIGVDLSKKPKRQPIKLPTGDGATYVLKVPNSVWGDDGTGPSGTVTATESAYQTPGDTDIVAAGTIVIGAIGGNKIMETPPAQPTMTPPAPEEVCALLVPNYEFTNEQITVQITPKGGPTITRRLLRLGAGGPAPSAPEGPFQEGGGKPPKKSHFRVTLDLPFKHSAIYSNDASDTTRSGNKGWSPYVGAEWYLGDLDYPTDPDHFFDLSRISLKAMVQAHAHPTDSFGFGLGYTVANVVSNSIPVEFFVAHVRTKGANGAPTRGSWIWGMSVDLGAAYTAFAGSKK